MIERKKVEDRIAIAFRDAKIPQTNRQLAPMGIDADDVIRHFLGKTRQQIEDDFQVHSSIEDYSYMTPMGVAYYLPSLLRIMLRQPWDTDLWIYLYGYLKPLKADELWWNLQELTQKQLGAIALWASFIRQQWSVDVADDCDPSEPELLGLAYGRLSGSA